MYYKLVQVCIYKLRQLFYYKLGQIQNVVTDWGSFVITNWGSCYKQRQNLLQIGVGFTNQSNYYKLRHNNRCFFQELRKRTPLNKTFQIEFRKEYNNVNPSSTHSHKMVKHTQTIRQQQPTNCLSMFDHFVGLAFNP